MNRPLFKFIFAGCLIACLFCSCNSTKSKEIGSSLAGDWLILFPDHHLENKRQEQLYAKAQDSIVALLGLKTISLRDDKTFYQTDSLFRSAGRWNYRDADHLLEIAGGGKGLDAFSASVIDLVNDTLRMDEKIRIEGETIRITWYLKRISNKKERSLFTLEGNSWRDLSKPQGEAGLRGKLKRMLNYYALYYEMVSNESAYFSYSRVFLPFKYYQHGVGLTAFDSSGSFAQCFASVAEAASAYHTLSAVFDGMRKQKYPSGKNFVIEYSMFMADMATQF